LSPVRAQRSTARSKPGKRVGFIGTGWHSRRPHQRRCGTGIWRDRDIAAGWRDLETPCASLPTRSPSQPRTPARKAGVLDPRQQLRERDRLSAGGKWIRTTGPPPEIVVDPVAGRVVQLGATHGVPTPVNRVIYAQRRFPVRRPRPDPLFARGTRRLYRGTARFQFWFRPATISTEKKTGRCHPPAAIRLCRSKATEGPTSRRLRWSQTLACIKRT
jgi:hypothetical protein